jgi:hypothetical protein
MASTLAYIPILSKDHNVRMGCVRVDNILSPPDVVGGVVEANYIVSVHAIVPYKNGRVDIFESIVVGASLGGFWRACNIRR